ncbi:polyketide synthase [Roseateles sp. DAIF2]|uniref:beta-ketoacyl [acyl carrier protein] synthase domain-containing protein n=1 Tax=Roseateles sp. DAIF2 TaxID=2714952 RepID=UPI0018A2CEAA|nr:polyketide synthase [Roseateles sp. DAIF2]QPF73615.1 polyketide synthase [Roseateles sp. DAIF2]
MRPSSSSMHLLGLALRHANLPALSAWPERLQALAEGRLPPLPDAQRLPEPAGHLGQYGVPPIYRPSIHRLQLHLLELADAALAQAEAAGVPLDREHCDVLFVTALGLNRSFENEARISALRWAAEAWADEPQAAELLGAWRDRLEQDFVASSHDKVGEMASAMAARIAGHFRLRGRVLALEAQEHGALEALRSAATGLEQGRAGQVLIVAAQTLDSPLWQRHPVSAAQWREAACALLLGSNRQAEGALARLRLDAGEAGTAMGLELRLDDQPLDLQALGGYTHAVQPLLGLALAAQLPRQATLLGRDGAGQAWRLGLEPPQAAPAPAWAEPAAVAVLACGAAFGSTRGSAAYWQALREPGHGFRALDPQRHQSALFLDPRATHAMAYYIDRASHAALPAELEGSGAVRELARHAAAELWAQPGLEGEADTAPLLVLCASTLTLPGERQAGARALLPRLLAILAELGAATGWAEPLRQRLAEGLARRIEAAGVAPELERLAASDIARAAADGRPARVLAVEAACASSMAALDLALDALRGGEVERVLVLGVELPVNVSDLLMCSAQRMLAPGLMASFGVEAAGFTPGDGAGAVLLTRADLAARRGQPVLARLLAAGASTDGKSLIAPNVAGQTRAMRRAFAQLEAQGLMPSALQFVETHGTGTLIGDEVETRSLAEVYAGCAQDLALGALKSKFGHCFAAAGMASLIKILLALRHEQLPPNHFERPLKPELGWPAHGFDPLLQARDWPRRPDRRRRAGLNAFGTGGINYHLLLEEA